MLETFDGLNHWQIGMIATGLLLQGAVIAIFPEEIIILTLGLLWGRGKMSFPEALLFTQLGLLPANAAMVFLGRKLGQKSILRKKGVQPALAGLHRYGARLIFVTRFTPLVRGPVYLAVGGAQYPFWRFARVDAIASCLQIPLLLWAGRWLEANSGSLQEFYQRLGILAGSVMAAVVLSFAWMEWRRKYR